MDFYDTSEEDESFAVVSTATTHTMLEDKTGKRFGDLRIQEWIHLVLSVVTVATSLSHGAVLMQRYETCSSQFVVAAMIFVILAFNVFFLCRGTYREQPFELLMQLAGLIVIWGLHLLYFAAINFRYTDELEDIYFQHSCLFYVSCAVNGLNIVSGIVVIWTYWSYEQIMFKTIGIDPTRVLIFRILLGGLSLLVFDFSLCLSTLFLFLRQGFCMGLIESLVIAFGGLVHLGWLLLGIATMLTESRKTGYIFISFSVLQLGYALYLLFMNIKTSVNESYDDMLLTWTVYIIVPLATLVHLILMATALTAQHYYGRGYGDVLVNGVHHSVKNSNEYEELRRILFHPINPVRTFYRPSGAGPSSSSSREVGVCAEVY